MAQSKNKERKQKLENFKSKQKKKNMDETTKTIPQVRSFPVWASNSTLEVSGLEWEAIYNYINVARQAVVAAESVMQRNIEAGKITNRFVDETGAEVSPEKVEEYTAQLQKLFAERVKQQEEESKAKKSPLVDETGDTLNRGSIGGDPEKIPVSDPSAVLRSV